MQKNDKFYTFLLSHSSKIHTHNPRRVQVSKRLVHGTIIGLFFILGISALALGIHGLLKGTPYADLGSGTTLLERASAQVPARDQAIDYSRPAASGDMAQNSGGPVLDDSVDGEDTELAGRLRALVATADPANVPAIWSHTGKINNEFGFRRNPFGGRTYEFHPGMDIDGERGDIVLSTANGTVIKAGWQGGYGNMIEIDHGNGLTTRYGHLSRIDVSIGDTVIRGQVVGLIGSTGRSTGPHLHYEMRLNDRPINPRHFLPPEPAELDSK
jgi:murein DD-endopeptidase MepM/ murein hydrolase activator NlpD